MTNTEAKRPTPDTSPEIQVQPNAHEWEPEAAEKYYSKKDLTPAEAERLAMLAEECAEVIQIVGKILRHGYDSYHPADPETTNRDLLAKELTDIEAVRGEMQRHELRDYEMRDPFQAVWRRKLRFTHHQEVAL